MSKIIAVANKKGGAGKSTLAINLAAASAAAQIATAIIDLDPDQQAASKWRDSRSADGPLVLSAVYGLLRIPGTGALILTAKAEETHNWIGYAKACGREKDLIVFNAESGLRFDPLHYEFTRPGRGAGDIESVIDFFTTLVSIGKAETGHGHDPFWSRGAEQIQRNVITVLSLAGERISIASIDRVIKSLPRRPEEYEEESWQKQSYCAYLISAIKARKEELTDDQWSDLDFATQYIFNKWPSFDERPRSSL
jgi:hypothetical protein